MILRMTSADDVELRRERRAIAERKEIQLEMRRLANRVRSDFNYLPLNTSCKMTAERSSATPCARGAHKGDVQ